MRSEELSKEREKFLPLYSIKYFRERKPSRLSYFCLGRIVKGISFALEKEGSLLSLAKRKEERSISFSEKI